MKKTLYILPSNKQEDSLFYLKNILNASRFSEIESGFFEVEIEEDLEYLELLKSIESDLFIDIVTFDGEIKLDNNLNNIIFRYLSLKHNGIYSLTNILEEICLSNDQESMQQFKTFFNKKISKDVIDTALGFIRIGNALSTSKELFIHRNTLNYRLDTIKKITTLDLKKFNDQLVFYCLFK